MNVLIVIAFVVVFISAFFIFFTMNALGERYIVCEGSDSDRVCMMNVLDGGFGFGVSFIFFFILLSFFTMYITFKNLKESVDS
jgi:hypothetical protein